MSCWKVFTQKAGSSDDGDYIIRKEQKRDYVAYYFRKNEGAFLCVSKTLGMMFFINRKMYLLKIPKWVVRTKQKLRNLIPTPYEIGLCCCDHYGRVMNSYLDIDWGAFDFGRFNRRWNGAGDGEVYNRLTWKQYFQYRREDREEYE